MKKTAVRALCKRLRKARKALTRMYAGGQDGAQSTAGEQLLAFLPQLCEAAESGLRDLRAAPGLPAGKAVCRVPLNGCRRLCKSLTRRRSIRLLLRLQAAASALRS